MDLEIQVFLRNSRKIYWLNGLLFSDDAHNIDPMFVGWVERSDTHQTDRPNNPMGIALLHPSYAYPSSHHRTMILQSAPFRHTKTTPTRPLKPTKPRDSRL